MDYKITIDEFEGPLDLLLHLIKQTDIDIFDINIAEITNQYLIYISQMKELNLNVDSEYIVMAAELIEIKAKELLPKEENEEEEEDPREELINRLIEYQHYKEITKEFQKLENERHNLYTKSPSFLEEYKNNELKIDESITLDDLIQAFAKFKEKKEFEKPLNTVVTTKEYSVHRRSTEILHKLHKCKKIKFEDLFEIYAKDYVVVTFLSILDLAKKGQIEINQNHNLESITINSKGEKI